MFPLYLTYVFWKVLGVKLAGVGPTPGIRGGVQDNKYDD